MSKFTDEWGRFAAIPYAFIEQSQNLSAHARWLFVVLRSYTNQKTECAWPSYDQLQEITRWSRPTVSKAIKELEEYGWLERRKRFGAPVIYVLKRPNSSQNELLDSEGLSADSLDSTVVNGMNHSSSQNELQSSIEFTTASLHELDRSKKTNVTRREGANAPRRKTKSRSRSQSANTVNQPVAEESSPGGKRKERKSVEVSAAVKFIRELVELYPPKGLWGRIDKFLGKNFDREGLRNCYETWIARGFKPTNYDGWLFDWYLNGIPEQGGKNGKSTARKSATDNLRETAEWFNSQAVQ
jgi:DNA-binding transcriptional regulator YhcF (GntR family)